MILAAVLGGIAGLVIGGSATLVVVVALVRRPLRYDSRDDEMDLILPPKPECKAQAEAHVCMLTPGHQGPNPLDPHLCPCGFQWRGLPLTGLERIRDGISRDRGDHAGPTVPIHFEAGERDGGDGR